MTKIIGLTAREVHEKKRQLMKVKIEYYRLHVDAFCEEVLEIPLNLYQKAAIRAMTKYNFLTFIWSRGLGKTWLSALFVSAMAILYPNTRIGIIAPSFRQSKGLIEQKIENDLMIRSEFLAQEISLKKHGTDQFYIKFWNNSQIVAMPIGFTGDKVRGDRFSIIVADEYAQLNPTIVQSVIEPMLVAKLDYVVGKQEVENTSKLKFIAISSAYFKFNHLYDRLKDGITQIKNGSEEHYVSALDYTMGLNVGLYNKSIIEEAKRKYPKFIFDMEYGSTFVDLSENAWISPTDLQVCSNLQPIELVGNDKDRYIMGIDVARVQGNDNTAVAIVKLVPDSKKQVVEKHLVCLRTFNGLTFGEQALEVRKLLDIFPCEEVHMDTTGIGLGLSDELAKAYLNPKTGDLDPPLCDVNNKQHLEDFPEGHFLIHGHKFSVEFNYQLGVSMKRNTQKHYLRMYGDESADNLGSYVSNEHLLQIEEAQMARYEIMSIESKPRGNFLTFDVPSSGMSSGRKDRWTAICLALWGADQIENTLFQEKSDATLSIGSASSIRVY